MKEDREEQVIEKSQHASPMFINGQMTFTTFTFKSN